MGSEFSGKCLASTELIQKEILYFKITGDYKLMICIKPKWPGYILWDLFIESGFTMVKMYFLVVKFERFMFQTAVAIVLCCSVNVKLILQ